MSSVSFSTKINTTPSFCVAKSISIYKALDAHKSTKEGKKVMYLTHSALQASIVVSLCGILGRPIISTVIDVKVVSAKKFP